MNGVVVVSFKKHNIRVTIRNGLFYKAEVPGDLMNITDKFTEAEKRILKIRALTKLMKKEDAELI